MAESADVVVIGAGCAGLAAATAVAAAGRRVVVVEQAPRLGGRASAFTDPATGERVDNGQHVLFGCYRDTYALLSRVGTNHLAPLQAGLSLAMVDGQGRRFDLRCPNLPPPWHLIAGLARWPALSWTDRWRALPIGRSIARARTIGAAALANEVASDVTVDEWLRRAGQTPRLCDWLWHPLVLAALNQPADVAAARPFVRVLGELFGPRKEDAAVGLSTVPLDELYAEPARAFIEARHGQVHLRESGRVVVSASGRVAGVETRHRTIVAPAVICAVPWFGFSAVWNGAPPRGLQPAVDAASAMRSSPIVTVNLWLDGPALDAPFVGLVNAPVHWAFDKRAITGGRADHLSVVTSGAEALAGASNDQAAQSAWAALQAAVPACRARRVVRSVVVRERRATFSLDPGQPQRPPTVTPLPGFFLAGDWTDTGLPATIEGAVLSGHRAAAASLACL